MRISDWSSDVCSSDLILFVIPLVWAAPFADPAAATDRIRDFDNTGGDNIAIAVDDVHQSLDLLGVAVREHACFFVVPPEISGPPAISIRAQLRDQLRAQRSATRSPRTRNRQSVVSDKTVSGR